MRTIKIQLDTQSIDNAIRELNNYKEQIRVKTKMFADRLADRGINIARLKTKTYGDYIVFTKTSNMIGNQNITILYARKTQDIIREWYYQGDPTGKRAVVDPLLMEEFGSGFFTANPFSFPGVGQGSFPGQKHAFDEDGWWWTTPDGVSHHSFGETPGQPLWNAREEMYSNIRSVAREVF